MVVVAVLLILPEADVCDRICAGRHLALPSLFINIASLLHVFDVNLPLDENGQQIPIEYEEGHGLFRSVQRCDRLRPFARTRTSRC